ncbi:MAG: glycosyl transferase family 2 [Chitinophagaceae bacterium]|nr:glycosyl transferase family 2 [Chitinophagaceae bacterium]
MSIPQRPLVSVIMPAYNVEAYITQAIESVLAQTYSHFELIIADDDSNDKTASYIHSFSDDRIVSLKNKKNLGYAGNMNTLFKAARGEYIVIQDADDYCTPNRLQVLVDFLQAHQAVDMVGSSYVKIDEEDKEEKVSLSEDRKEIESAFDKLLDPLPVLNGAVMFRRKIIEEGFFFRPLLYVNRAQDDDWLFRVSEKFCLANVNEYLYYYRYNPSSMTMNLSSINYFSLFSGDYVRFLKKYRMETGIDLLAEKNTKEIGAFFQQKKKEVTQQQPAYLELYIAHKYLALEDRARTIQWLFKALLKNPGDAFIWKKIGFVLLNRKN